MGYLIYLEKLEFLNIENIFITLASITFLKLGKFFIDLKILIYLKLERDLAVKVLILKHYVTKNY